MEYSFSFIADKNHF